MSDEDVGAGDDFGHENYDDDYLMVAYLLKGFINNMSL
jgi:hypothetical protein